MMKHWKYLKSVLRHKWYVYQACRDLGLSPWVGLVHDWDKFLPRMWFPYANYFYSNPRTKDGTYNRDQNPVDAAFDLAWLGHQRTNKHHWQWWVLFKDDGGYEALAMPDRHRREMLADWRGAGKAYVKDWTPAQTTKWYLEHCDIMVLHPDTRTWIEEQLGVRDATPSPQHP